MKKALLALAVAGAAVSAQADVQLSGQVNSAVLFGGDVDDPTIVDNNTTGTRFRIKASKKAKNGLKYGTRLEYQFQDNQSNNLADTLDQRQTAARSEVRYSDVYVKGAFGQIGIGKGDGAANGTFESYGMLNFLGGALSRLLFQGAVDVDYRDIDGASRQNRVRYDSPNFSGFKFAASVDNGDQNEFAVQYNGKVLGGKLRVRAGTVDTASGADVTSMSLAYKHSSGLGIALSDGEVDGGNEADWAMLSYSFGKTTISYGTGESGAAGGNDYSVASVVYKPVKGVEVYLNVADADNATDPDGKASALGARVKF